MGLIGKTAPYLLFLVMTYILALFLMALIVWQIWGDKLQYFRNVTVSTIYTLAMFDLKTMYLANDFMAANQYAVPAIWLFILIILFAVVLHYTITLQYSAYFHIYFNIGRKYEDKLHGKHHKGEKKDTEDYTKLKETQALKIWLSGILKNPFKDEPEEDDE